MDENQTEDDFPEGPSKTSRKRDAARLRALGEQIANLPPSIRASLPMDDSVREAIDNYLRFPSKEARRRQMQFVGKLLREDDHEAIIAALEDRDEDAFDALRQKRDAERWRERMLNEGVGAINEFIGEHPRADRNRLRKLVRQASVENTGSDAEVTKKASTTLYRTLIADMAGDE